MTRLALRELRIPAEFEETVNVAKEAWGFSERALSPANDLIAATHAGGLTAAVFEGKRMLGFVHGLPRTNRGEPCQHSHLLAVRPEAQGRGLAARLKLFQRSWCLARGIALVTWTYDPFLVKNATLNLVRLQGRVSRLLPDFYGPLGGIYHELPTDRFEVSWRLDDPMVEEAARGRAPAPAPADALPFVRGSRIPNARRVALPILPDAPAVYRRDPEGSLRARLGFRAQARALFAAGFEAVSVAERDGAPVYVLARR